MKRANYRAPRRHGEALILPEPDRLPGVVSSNRERVSGYDFEVLGHGVQAYRLAARAGLLKIPYACVFGTLPAGAQADPAGPIVMTGHQPALYHPGVWLKNFLAGHLAEAVGGVAVNVNVNNDESHQLAVRAPVVVDGRARVVEVPYLRPTGGVPYEELGEEYLLDGVADALRAAGVAEPMCRAVADYWERLRAASGRGSLSKMITCARHQLERGAGLENLESQVSDVARLREYRLFMLDILSNLERFHAAHNGGLATFRRVHHERNAAQPIPDLGREGHRWEMPFWVWQRHGRRERLWAQSGSGLWRLYLDGRPEPFVTIEQRHLDARGAKAIAQLEDEERRGIKIRPRALTLTLFARMFVCDAFIHGLGGAIYDKVTDEIVRDYYGVEPPALVMATGTALLPVECCDVGPADRRALERRLRDMRHNPDRRMEPAVRKGGDVRTLVERKRDLVETPRPTKRGRGAAWRELHEVNGRLAALMDGEPEATRTRLAEVNRQLADNAILANREYAFALHPRDQLVAFYADVTAVSGGGPE